MTTTSTKLASRLLALPAELRNAIYRYTLCNNGHIILTRQNYTQPPLLQTCQQIRKEAGPIYYLENTFNIDTRGFDPAVMLRFEHDARELVDLDKLEYYIVHASRPVFRWIDLVRWLKAFFDGEARGMEIGQYTAPDDPYWVAKKAFDMVGKLKVHIGWEQIEEVMETYKEATMGVVKWQ